MVYTDTPRAHSNAGAVTGLSLAVSVLRIWAGHAEDHGEIDAESARSAATILAQNRLLGLAGGVLSALAPHPEILRTVAGFRRLTSEMNGASLITLRRLMTVLDEIPARVIVYKGVVLQQELYGTPFARPSSDVDLLTAPGDYALVAAALQKAGYRLDHHTATLWWRWFLAEQQFRAGETTQSLDLHHRLQQPGCPMPRRPDRLLSAATSTPFLGASVLSFRADHALLVAAMSLAKALHHREPAGRYVGDAERLMRRLTPDDWKALHDEAKLLGLDRTLALAIRSVDAIFASVPAHEMRAILPDVSNDQLRWMLLAPDQSQHGLRRRRLLRALCDRPVDALSSWFLMAASETARRASPHRSRNGAVQ